MVRVIGKLSAMAVKSLGRGMHADGAGLYLCVNAAGARSWIYRYMLNSRAREMGLGPAHTVGLTEARKRAGEWRLKRLDGWIRSRRGRPSAARRSSTPRER